MLVRFNKRTIVGGSTYAKDSEHDLANDLADQVVAAGNGVVVGLGEYSNEARYATDSSGTVTGLVGPDGTQYSEIHSARMNPVDAEGTRLGTIIPTSTAGTSGLFATKVLFTGSGSVVYDTLGGVADYANGRMIVPAGFRFCRVAYSVAFAANDVGWRGCRIKNSAGQNYGNQRMATVGLGATTNSQYTTPWIQIVESGGTAPNSINVGDYFELYPAQTSGGDLEAMADVASSWFSIELMR